MRTTTRPWPLMGAALMLSAVLALGCRNSSTPTPTNGHGHEQEHAAAQDAHGHHEEEETHAGHDPHDEGEDHGGHDDHGHEEAVLLSPRELEAHGVVLRTVEEKSLAGELILPGEVVFNPDAMAHATVRANGIVADVARGLGETVRRGDVLAVVQSPDLLAAQTAYLQAREEADLAQKDHQRARQIHEATDDLLAWLATHPTLEAVSGRAVGQTGEDLAMLLGAYADTVLTQRNLQRERALLEQRITSQAEMDEALNEAQKAEAVFEGAKNDVRFRADRALLAAASRSRAAKTNLQAAGERLRVLDLDPISLQETPSKALSDLPIRAPIRGTIVEKHLGLGENVTQGQEGFLIADTSRVWVHLRANEEEVRQVAVGQPVVVSSQTGGHHATAKVDTITPNVEESSRKALVRLVLENPQGRWKPGAFVQGIVSLTKTDRLLSVHRAALQTWEGNTVVFVQKEGAFHPLPVKTGHQSGDWVAIQTGVSPGQLYAAEGSFLLKAELGKSEAGHSH